VAAVGHDPERRHRNPAKQFDGLLDRIERIAIAVDDQVLAVIVDRVAAVKFMSSRSSANSRAWRQARI
jgi:hypothetical protein